MIRYTWFLAILLVTISAAHAETVFRVRDFGAVGDGIALDTPVIQKAIDACASSGGGMVYFSPGSYLTGTLFLKSNIRIFLEAGAVVRGSTHSEDYPPIKRSADGAPTDIPAFNGGGVLIYGEDIHNVSIEGKGTIDGQGSAFWFPEMLSPKVRKPMPERPRALIAIIEGESLAFRDITLTNSACYTLWTIGCDNVVVDGITIRNPHDGPNTDGIDIDCCNHVRIANCFIDGGDDAIAIKSDAFQLGEDKPCENIVVTNCTLCSVPACGVRVGYEGDAILRNCTFSNLTIVDTDIGLDIISILPDRPNIRKGTRCENITFNNIVMRNVNQAIYFWMGQETEGEPQSYLKNILVSNVIAESRHGSYIGGYEKKACENITLHHIQMALTGDIPKEVTPTACGVWGGAANPYALYCHRVNGLRIHDIDIDFRGTRGAWRYGVFCNEVDQASIAGIYTYGMAPLHPQGIIGLEKTAAAIRDCDIEADIPTFLCAVEHSSIFIDGCNLASAKNPLMLDATSTRTPAGANP